MSDNEGPAKKGGYRVEYASSGRAKCKGPKPCTGTDIPKGALRLGSLVEIRGAANYSWRHWGCASSKLISNMKERLDDVEELDGFDELRDEDKDRIRRAFEEGKVADADIPPSAGKPAAGDAVEGEKPKKKRAPAKKKTETEAEEGGDEKPKKAPARKPRVKVGWLSLTRTCSNLIHYRKPSRRRMALNRKRNRRRL
ncbi:zf-PARP-domain-containing protein [Pisolithus croceorrhizus]|nr:zf-PARP-domain-containing protein [Pisolithus croceorrhizus]